jgi:hypothetical protein
MKLKKVTTNDPSKRISVSLRQSVIESLGAYQVFYRRNTSDEISFSLLVEEMVRTFMKEDKEFAKFLAANPDAGKDAVTPETSASTSKLV